MLTFLIVMLVSLPVAAVYGVMAGFTLKVARRNGMDKTVSNIMGAFWPLGLGVALSYGKTDGIPPTRILTGEERDDAERKDRDRELAAQDHNTRMAELKAKEAIALEKAMNPNKAIEGKPGTHEGYPSDYHTRRY